MSLLRIRLFFISGLVVALAAAEIGYAQDLPSTKAPRVESAEKTEEGKQVVTTPEQEAKPKEIGRIVKEIEVRFSGARTVSDSVVLANMRTKVGEPFTRTNSEDDVRALYATGLFANVRLIEEPLGDGVKIVAFVQGKPKLKDVLFEGNTKYKTERLKKEIKCKVDEVVSERQVAEDANALVEFYQKAGYHNVKVGFEIMPDEMTGQSIAKFTITEGERVKIARVNFEGNKAFTAKILRRKTETKNHNWISWITKKGFLKETVVEEDKDRLAEFYRSEGYIDAEVKDVKYDKPDAKSIVVTFFLYEGNQYKVGSFALEGNQLFPTEEIRKKLAMKEGDLFTPGGLQKDVKAIQDLYGARGYIDCTVRPTRAANVTTSTMDVKLDIREGDMAYLDLIEIRGNAKTKDKVIRREIAVVPGEIYNSVKVDASKQRLENLGYFSHVSATAEETDIPNRKNLVLAVEEQRTGSLSFGAGFSSVDSILGFAEVSQGNFDIANPPYFTGAGQKARVRAQFGARRQDYIISFTEPWFLNKRLAAGFDLFYNDANYISAIYNQRNYGGDVRLGTGLGEFNRADLTYKFEQIEIYNVASGASTAISSEAGTRSKSSVGLNLNRDTRDNLTLPTKGYKVELWSEVAGGPALKGQTHTYKAGVSGQAYFLMPWWEQNILSFNGSSGIVETWDEGTRVPLFDRWFLGGPYSVRGFKFRDIGPKDGPGGEPVGGKTMAFLQTEYSIPIIERVRFATFVDAGQVWGKAYDWSSSSPVVGAGVGLRLNLPIGPINLDYGWPIRKDQNITSDNGQFSFNVGTKF
ncbi:MAG: outer membrane protein assembly factor BamA [Verrucomicrobiae bacterium]|nr:outer membrane protein assembly factor BamA [Verrucomicrobiae bacterium]